MIKAVTVTNYLGEKLRLELARPEESGFAITSITGIGPGKATINSSELATSDGGRFNSARLPNRNIVIAVTYIWPSKNNDSIESIRQLSYKYFPIKRKVTLRFETDNRTAEIDGYVESNEPSIFSEKEGASISIMCPDPYFRSASSGGLVYTSFGVVEPKFSFPLEITNSGFMVGEIKDKVDAVIVYTGDAETGVTITVSARGDVSKFRIHNATTGELMDFDFARVDKGKLISGDVLTINTVKGNKSVKLLRGGTTTNVLRCLSRDSDWLSLAKGDNELGYRAYNANNGQDDLTEVNTNVYLQVSNRILYEGV